MRKKSMLRLVVTLLCIAMVFTMIVPMALTLNVAAAEGDPEVAYVLGNPGTYYVSDWIGEERKKTPSDSGVRFGQWVNSDGQYNGCLQWSGDYSKITLDNTTGVLTFKETEKPSMKFYPGQISRNGLKDGSCYLAMDIYFESGTYEHPDKGEVPLFSGFTFTHFANNSDQVLFSIATDGTIYKRNPANMPGAATMGDMKLVEGWNTLEIVLLYKDADGNVLDSNNNEKYTLDDGTKNPNWPVDKDQTVAYFRASASGTAAETRGFTKSDLQESFISMSYPVSDMFYKDAGTNSSLKPLMGGQGEFKLRNMVAANLYNVADVSDPNAGAYRVTYAGYPALSQTMPVSCTAKQLTVPAVEGVQFWKSGTGDDMVFYKPGDEMLVIGNMELSPAEGSELNVATLSAALSRINLDEIDYTYAELASEKAYIEEAALAADLPADNEYMIQKDALIAAMNDRMSAIETATTALIEYAAIFTDESQSLSDRAEAFLAAEDECADADETYSEEGATAVAELSRFRLTWQNVEEKYMEYIRLIEEEVGSAAPGFDLNAVYASIISNWLDVSKAYPTFELDPSVEEGYLANMEEMKLGFDALENNITEMYTYMASWAEDWNNFKKALYGNRAQELPAPLKECVDKYNNTVKALNEEIVEAAIFAMAPQNALIDSEVGVALMSDIKAKVAKKYDDAQEIPEE